MTNNPSPEAHLLTLGFTETEARTYCELLKLGRATGYRLAQAVGKAPANIYQALAALTQKGAVLLDEAEAKTYRPVPPADLLAAMETQFAARRAAAVEALTPLHAPSADDHVYQLKSASQVMEAARRLIADARETLLFDLFPEPLATLRPALEAARARGVLVAGRTYERPALKETLILAWPGPNVLIERWPGVQVTVVADARAHVLALLSRDGRSVLNGVGSDSPYLACVQHSSLSAEIRLAAASPKGDDPLAHISLLNARPPGLRQIAAAADQP
jgi:hypothetical protein